MVRSMFVVVGLLAVLILAGACSDPADWEPRGTVKWLQWVETEDEEAAIRTARMTCSVVNVGRVDLATMDLALTVKTDKEDYHFQFRAELNLPPGKSAYQTVELKFRSQEERGSLEGLKVDSQSFR